MKCSLSEMRFRNTEIFYEQIMAVIGLYEHLWRILYIVGSRPGHAPEHGSDELEPYQIVMV